MRAGAGASAGGVVVRRCYDFATAIYRDNVSFTLMFSRSLIPPSLLSPRHTHPLSLCLPSSFVPLILFYLQYAYDIVAAAIHCCDAV